MGLSRLPAKSLHTPCLLNWCIELLKSKGGLRIWYEKATYAACVCYHILKSKTFQKVKEGAGAFLHLLRCGSLAHSGLSGLFKCRSEAPAEADKLLHRCRLHSSHSPGRVITISGAYRGQQRRLTPSRRHLISTV